MHHINKICCCFFKSLPSILNNENSDCTIGPIWLVLYHSTFIGFGREWSGGAMVLGKLPGPIVLAVGAGGVVWTFLLSSIFSLLFLPLFGRRPDID